MRILPTRLLLACLIAINLPAGALAAEAAGQMNAQKITRLFVVEGGRPLGIVRMHDILRAAVL